MKSLHKLGKYHNLDKLNKIAINSCYTTKLPTKHNYIDSLRDDHDYSYALWGTLGVKWHVDDIHENRKYSVILVVRSDNYELYASTVNEDYSTTFRSINEQMDYLLVQRKDTQRLVLRTGDILLLDTSRYHKLENTKQTKDPFIFINLDIDFIPRVKEAIKVVNYFVHDFLITEDLWAI